MRYPFNFQLDSFDCGPACLQMLCGYYGKKYSLDFLRERCFINREGVSILGVSQAAESLGFRTLMVKADLESLKTECPLPAILHWNQEHFVVLYKVEESVNIFNRNSNKRSRYKIADPAKGIISIDETTFTKCWLPENNLQGVALFLEPTADFFKKESEKPKEKSGILFLLSYLRPYKRQMIKLCLYLLISTFVTVMFPYLTKNMVDKGILSKSYSLVLLFAVSQIVLFLSGTVFDLLRSWLLLHINSKISLSIVSDFLRKLLKLPIRFFDSKSVGDISQRINDHHRIENFLTGEIINSAFSLLQIGIFSFILLNYSFTIWLVFVILSVLAILWIFLFQKRREKLDYIRFTQNKAIQEKLFELIVGMQEIKLFGSEKTKRWEWEFLQQRMYKLNIKSLVLEQYRQTGFIFLTYVKNILISYLAAISVIEMHMTLGTMLSISFIIGQTNGPLQQLITFFKSAQDAKLSLNRLQEVHQKEEEEKENTRLTVHHTTGETIHADIHLKHLSFQYQGPRSLYVLKDLNMIIPKGKITAIVGTSGSGKTTLLKLLLGFYKPVEGQILIGNENIENISPKFWRSKCGTVMQDGYIFSDTITRNIALDGLEIDEERMRYACAIANIDEFALQLPQGYKTRIGSNGIGLSGGQKQRILIARSVYKNPNYLFFDEATSSLDANNEKAIMDNLNSFFKEKTVVIIAHRLSTVKNADNIIVLEKGKIIETGSHIELTQGRGKYYELVRNQLNV